jgi:hypothetical protein
MIQEYLHPRFKARTLKSFFIHITKKRKLSTTQKKRKKKEQKNKNIAYNTTRVVIWSIKFVQGKAPMWLTQIFFITLTNY